MTNLSYHSNHSCTFLCLHFNDPVVFFLSILLRVSATIFVLSLSPYCHTDGKVLDSFCLLCHYYTRRLLHS